MSVRALASETAIYGLSSILGRALYFLLTPLYTSLFAPREMGAHTSVFVVFSFLFVIAGLRLDVAYFRNFKEAADERALFGTAWLTTAGVGGALGLVLSVLSPKLAAWYGFAEYQWLFALAGGILFFDALVELPLARLRMTQRPWRFAGIRLGGILLNLGLNLLWLYALPRWPGAPDWLSTDFGGIAYIFLANLCASAAVFAALLPELRGMKWRIDGVELRRLLAFSLPLVFVGLGYIINEMIDRTLLPLLWPGGKQEGLTLNGVYSQNYKLAMLLALFTQAFRYGAEPFFFREAGELGAEAKYASVARLYLTAALLGALAVAVFLPALSQQFLRDPAYRVGSDVVLVLLAANVCLGMYYNFSVWYKVTDATRVGAYISLGGAVVTIVLNVLLIPRYGFYGCAWATLACYGGMMAATYVLGQRRYPVPYEVGRMLRYTLLATAIGVAVYRVVPTLTDRGMLQLAIEGGTAYAWAVAIGAGTIGLALFVGLVVFWERRSSTVGDEVEPPAPLQSMK